MRKRVWYLIAGVMAVAAVAAVISIAPANRGSAQGAASPEACASPMASPEASPMAGMTMASPEASPTACGSPAASGGSAVTIDMEDIKFVPNAVTIPANTPVKFTFDNKGALPHNFSIDKLHVSVNVDPGKTGETTINAPAGTYQFYCDVPGHKEAGMVGTLTVK